jgi:phosphatidylglycerol:prolipoprotein diacylglycerol transferase
VYASVLASLVALVATSQHSTGLPFIEVGARDLFGLPIQPFGIIVATGVLIGAEVMRRYALKRGADEDDLRGLTGWVVVTGFIGAHVFDILAYEQDKLAKDPLILLKLWDGISSYGGFLGGAMGWWFYVWWKRLTPGMWADSTVIGLLLGFSIGRIGCTLVHDHIGRATDFALGVDYPVRELIARDVYEEIQRSGHHVGSVIRAHNMAMYELAYLIPVNALILAMAFSKKKRWPAGLLAVLTGLLYAPVRFVLEFWRLNQSDTRYAGLTFAQWLSIVAFGAALYILTKIWKHGSPAPLEDELGGRVGGRLSTLAALAKANAAAAKTDDRDDDEATTKAGKGKAKSGKGGGKDGGGKSDGGKPAASADTSDKSDA